MVGGRQSWQDGGFEVGGCGGLGFVSSPAALCGDFPAASIFERGRVWLGHEEGSKGFMLVIFASSGTAGIGWKNCRKLGSRTCKTVICQLSSSSPADFGRTLVGGGASTVAGDHRPGKEGESSIFTSEVLDGRRPIFFLLGGELGSTYGTSTPASSKLGLLLPPRSGFF